MELLLAVLQQGWDERLLPHQSISVLSADRLFQLKTGVFFSKEFRSRPELGVRGNSS